MIPIFWVFLVDDVFGIAFSEIVSIPFIVAESKYLNTDLYLLSLQLCLDYEHLLLPTS
jgi:hypothetical protein